MANADGARLEPFQFVYDNTQIPTGMKERMTLRLEKQRHAK